MPAPSIRFYVETFPSMSLDRIEGLMKVKLLWLLREKSPEAVTFAEVQKALDIPNEEPYTLSLQSVIFDLYQRNEISFNARKTNFRYKERLHA